MTRYGDVELTQARRKLMLASAVSLASPGDLLFFYHRTSWRSRWIRRITGCHMPHVCVYLGRGRVVGMLRGRVCRHMLRRFFRDEYDLRFVRGSEAVRDAALTFLGRREHVLDLVVLGVLVLLERLFPSIPFRRLVAYRMRGVTCSGLASSAWHQARSLTSELEPMKYTPRDVESLIGDDAFLEARLLPVSSSPWTMHELV